ncbi:MAG: biosynthetic-type acetolactate synthase large subunit [Armatimonadota bacterium]|jgi:acetolactate synthase-1/2/3 large subunit
MATTTGARALWEILKEQGVEVVFGISGGAVIPIYDVLGEYEDDVRHILTRHEQGAAFMAGGYARATGRVGVCMATSGPGATNLVTGIADAYMDSIPIVAITGQVRTTVVGTDAFQEADTTGITLPITKHNYLVRDPEELCPTLRHAFHIAKTGRPGPVLVDLPSDITGGELEFTEPCIGELPGYRPNYKGHPRMIREGGRLIPEAKRPLIYFGGGVIASGAADELLRLVDKTNIFATYTLHGKGGIPETHPLSLGMLGMHGTAYANLAIAEADLIVAIGARFDDRITGKLDEFGPNRDPDVKVIHIDIDPAEIGKAVPVTVPIVGDVKAVLAEFVEAVEPREPGAWEEQLEAWRNEHPIVSEQGDGPLKPQWVIQRIYEITNGDAICATDVGQHQMWTAQRYLAKRPRQFLSSGGLGAMGFGFPAAIGAQVAFPDALVVDIAGDGSIQMNIQELATATIERCPVVVCIMNNGYLGMVRQWQELLFERRYAGVDLRDRNQQRGTCPDFVKVAQAYGAQGIRVTTPQEVRPALEKAMGERNVPTFIDFIVQEEESVFPMIPVGKAHGEQWLQHPEAAQ